MSFDEMAMCHAADRTEGGFEEGFERAAGCTADPSTTLPRISCREPWR